MADEKQRGLQSKSEKSVRKPAPSSSADSDETVSASEDDGQEIPPERTPAEGEPAGQGGAATPRADAETPRAEAQEAAGASEEVREPAYASLPAPSDLEPGDPEADAPPPGPAPPGDSRSFRRSSGGVEEFCLIYRRDNFLVTRSGVVGKNGTWEVVEYPSVGAAAHAYAQQCSNLVGRGFYDLPRA